MPAEPRGPDPTKRAVEKRVVIYGLLAVAFIALGRWSRVIESFGFFGPSTAAFRTPAGIEDVEIPTAGGGTLHAWWLPAETPDGQEPVGTVLFCHGNAGNLPDHLGFVDRLPAAGFNVLLFDYRGFGRSSKAGIVTRESLLADAGAALRYLLDDRGVPADRLALFGHSMGGVMAMNLADRAPAGVPVAAVAPFASFPSVAADHVPVLGWLLIAGGRAAESQAADFGDRPLLLIHGGADRIVRSAHSERIAGAARDAEVAVELIIEPDADHVSVFDPPADAQAKAAEFFERHLRAGSAR